jgi:hypothetical protein
MPSTNVYKGNGRWFTEDENWTRPGYELERRRLMVLRPDGVTEYVRLCDSDKEARAFAAKHDERFRGY